MNNLLMYKISEDLRKVDIAHGCCSMDILPEIVARLIDALIQEDEINISPKRMNLTNEDKIALVISKRKDILNKAMNIPAKLDMDIHIDDGLPE